MENERVRGISTCTHMYTNERDVLNHAWDLINNAHIWVFFIDSLITYVFFHALTVHLRDLHTNPVSDLQIA